MHDDTTDGQVNANICTDVYNVHDSTVRVSNGTVTCTCSIIRMIELVMFGLAGNT